MSSKDLFRNSKNRILEPVTIEEYSAKVESPEFVEEFNRDKERYIPPVDYSNPKEFVRYGLAQQYYEESIAKIYNSYPYDGSLSEQLKYHNDSTELDKWIFENEYPRTAGHVVFSPNGYSAILAATGGYANPTTKEYIYLKGGPNVNNIYAPEDQRDSNLLLSGDLGITTEFWIKKTAFVDGVDNEVILDIWSTGSIATDADYGRMTLGLVATGSLFNLTLLSGSTGFQNQQFPFTASANWQHHAFSIGQSATPTSFAINHFLNGEFESSIETATWFDTISGSMIGTIGSLVTSSHGTVDNNIGWGKLSASLDELRFWKTVRSSEDIRRNWNQQVGGGNNTDEANTDLGFYYKFNEGLFDSGSVNARDAIVLDYSGRATNGSWTGYALNSRVTSSAMESAGATRKEFYDPIIYRDHPSVVSKISELSMLGEEFDSTNAASMYHNLPNWIVEEDSEKDSFLLRNLTQTICNYLDSLHVQIERIPRLQDSSYEKEGYKPFFDNKSLLESHGLVVEDLFSKADVIEEIFSRDLEDNFEEKIHNVKNLIYKNIYNNLNYIYKSKGTEKAFRNMLACLGVGDDLIKINIYSDNQTFEFKDNKKTKSVKTNCINFNHPDNFSANIYQFPKAGDSETQGWMSIDGGAIPNLGFTLESDVIFPKKFEEASEFFFNTPFLTSSVFGIREATGSLEDETTDGANAFGVFAIRPERNSNHVKFSLDNTKGTSIPVLTSSLFYDVYDDQKWTFAVKLKHDSDDDYPILSGSGNWYDGKIEFYGIQTELGEERQSFYLTGTVDIRDWTGNKQRVYCGASRTNLTGSIEIQSDVKVSSVRYWADNISNDSIKAHSQDPNNFGTLNPSRNSYGSLWGRTSPKVHSSEEIPEMETLALHWSFDSVTGSDSTGVFTIDDASSGSLSNVTRYGSPDGVDMGALLKYQHPGQAFGFATSSLDVSEWNYVISSQLNLPENINSSDMTEIKNFDDAEQRSNSRPINHFFSIEKSMYQTISEEQLKFFSTISSFDNLIGEPVHRYRRDYKQLGKLRNLFFEKVANEISLERYVDFYKWIDSAMFSFLEQLIPAAANFSDSMRTVVESHILERNKYQSRLPFIKFRHSDPEGSAGGNHFYPMMSGSAPVDGLQTFANTFWWKNRAEITLRDTIRDMSAEALRYKKKIFNLTSANQSAPSASLNDSSPDGTILTIKNTKTRLID